MVQFVGTVLLPAGRAQALIIFGGDGGCLVLGTALMLSFYAPGQGAWKTNGLRWGLLGIGAAAFTDASLQWWAARTDEDAIPFGQQEYAGLSDPSKLVETFGWTTPQMVHAYVALSLLCAAILAVAWVRGLRVPRSSLRALGSL